MRYSRKVIENTIRLWKKKLLEAETEEDRIGLVIGLMQDEPRLPNWMKTYEIAQMAVYYGHDADYGLDRPLDMLLSRGMNSVLQMVYTTPRNIEKMWMRNPVDVKLVDLSTKRLNWRMNEICPIYDKRHVMMLEAIQRSGVIFVENLTPEFIDVTRQTESLGGHAIYQIGRNRIDADLVCLPGETKTRRIDENGVVS